jgi:hypothetical protein
MKIRKGFQSSSLISQFCSIFGLTHPVVVLDITEAPTEGGLYVERPPLFGSTATENPARAAFGFAHCRIRRCLTGSD